VVLVEHKMKMVMGLCERLIVLHHGGLLAEGTLDEIRGNAEVRRGLFGAGVDPVQGRGQRHQFRSFDLRGTVAIVQKNRKWARTNVTPR
jgi:ABC-type methionine transport system ATPase subunit